MREELAGEAARIRGADVHRVRMLVDEVADVVNVAFGEDPAVVDEEDVRGHRLDLVQDVARDDDRLSGAGPFADQADRAPAGERVHARERLVEDEERGVVDDGLRELDALAHALAVGANLLARRVHQIDDGERAPRRFVGRLLVEAVEAHERGHPLEARHPLVERVLLRAKADLEIQPGIPPDGLAEDRHRALARPELAGDELHERRLAGTVRTEESRDAGRHPHADVVEADDLAVPLRHMLGGDDRSGGAGRAHVTTSTPRTRRSRIEIEIATSPTITMRDTCHGVM